jgi:hypothetical protein
VQNTDIPGKLVKPFGAGAGGGYIRTIPTASQIGVVDGAASLTDGFPPLNATPIGAGGIPPDIKDMNGILFEISGWARWVAAGGPIYFDATFAAAIGGYPLGAVVQSAATPGLLFVSTIQNNTNNPDATPTGWQGLVSVPATQLEVTTGTDTAKFVTPATLAGLRATSADIIAGVDATKYLSPASFYAARASAAEVAAGANDHKYITPAALAAGASVGIVRLFGGIVMQYGTIYRTILEGNYSSPFNTPFATAVDSVVISPINNTGDTSHTRDIFVQINMAATTLSYFSYTGQQVDSGYEFLEGITWFAFGR